MAVPGSGKSFSAVARARHLTTMGVTPQLLVFNRDATSSFQDVPNATTIDAFFRRVLSDCGESTQSSVDGNFSSWMLRRFETMDTHLRMALHRNLHCCHLLVDEAQGFFRCFDVSENETNKKKNYNE